MPHSIFLLPQHADLRQWNYIYNDTRTTAQNSSQILHSFLLRYCCFTLQLYIPSFHLHCSTTAAISFKKLNVAHNVPQSITVTHKYKHFFIIKITSMVRVGAALACLPNDVTTSAHILPSLLMSPSDIAHNYLSLLTLLCNNSRRSRFAKPSHAKPTYSHSHGVYLKFANPKSQIAYRTVCLPVSFTLIPRAILLWTKKLFRRTATISYAFMYYTDRICLETDVICSGVCVYRVRQVS